MTAGGGGSDSRDGNGGKARRGAFIVLEGVDRCGKTTQVARLVETLTAEGHTAEAIRFPDRTTTIGQMINAYLAQGADLDDHAIHLLFSANRWEAVAGLKAKLAAGTTLVCDRYAFSGVAFSAAKDGIDFAWCKECDRGLPKPDTVIYLDITPEAAATRGQYGAERYENEGMQARVRANFARLIAEAEGEGAPWRVVDAAQSIEAVSAAVGKAAREAVAAAKAGAPLAALWPVE